MDTYQERPTNFTAFELAIDWYTAHGCAADRMSIGLLAGQASTSTEATRVLDAVRRANVSSVDIWANLWSQPELLEAWQAPLAAFVGAREDQSNWHPGWVEIAEIAAGSLVMVVFGAAVVARRRRRRSPLQADLLAAEPEAEELTRTTCD